MFTKPFRWNLARRAYLSAVVALVAGCAAATNPSQDGVRVAFDFRQSLHGWNCSAAFYSTSLPYESFEITTDYHSLRGELANQGSAWFLYGIGNPMLFPFCTKRVQGLVPNRTYLVDLMVEIATNTTGASNCGGLGGPPGLSPVFAGMSRQEPKPFVRGTTIDINLDFGNGATGGNVVMMGNIAKSEPGPCTSSLDNPWELKVLRQENVPLSASASGDGWLVAGFELHFHKLGIYITKFTADLR